MANTLATVSDVMSRLADGGAECFLFGGWAEELLGLRPPGPHRDIDLVHCGENFAAIERVLAARSDIFTEVAAKRFAHKRAFVHDGVLCEVLLVHDADHAPFTLFWGDTRFDWEVPLLEARPIQMDEAAFRVVSRRQPGQVPARTLADPAGALDRSRFAFALGSGLIDQSQKMTVAAMQMAEKKVWAHRS